MLGASHERTTSVPIEAVFTRDWAFKGQLGLPRDTNGLDEIEVLGSIQHLPKHSNI
jgi:hypothetical protein